MGIIKQRFTTFLLNLKFRDFLHFLNKELCKKYRHSLTFFLFKAVTEICFHLFRFNVSAKYSRESTFYNVTQCTLFFSFSFLGIYKSSVYLRGSIMWREKIRYLLYAIKVLEK